MPWADPNHDFTWTPEQVREVRQKQAGKWMWVDASDSRVTAHIIHQYRLHGWTIQEMPQGEVAACVHPNRYISMLDLGATELPQQKGAPIPDEDEIDHETECHIQQQLELHLRTHGVTNHKH